MKPMRYRWYNDADTRPNIKPYGCMLHTTGGGVHTHPGIAPVEAALKYYTESGTNVGPHLVLDTDGQIYRLLDDKQMAYHAGIIASVRTKYLNGSWKAEMNNDALVTAWESRWNVYGVSNPAAIYPSKSPNADYIGIEMIPAYVDHDTFIGTRVAPKDRFNAEQYLCLAELLLMLSTNHSFDYSNPRKLVTHSDTNPLGRPGWDPGIDLGYFNMDLLRAIIRHGES